MILTRLNSLMKTGLMWIYSYKCCKKSIIRSSQDTVNLIKKTHKSVIRYGDGEFFLMSGHSIHYQEYRPELSKCLKDIILDYTADSNKYLLCMPKYYFECTGLDIIKSRVLFRSWTRPRFMFKYDFDKYRIEYGDAFMFADGNADIYEEIWNDSDIKSVVFVHNKKKYADYFAEKYNKKVCYVEIPSRNAFNAADFILKNILKAYNSNGADLVLISAGPCAKYLVWKLSDKGVWAIDTGHCWDEPLNKGRIGGCECF